jgi:putative mRNA 3-end processing factor
MSVTIINSIFSTDKRRLAPVRFALKTGWRTSQLYRFVDGYFTYFGPLMTSAPKEALLTFRPEGIYCLKGDFFIDPWKPVKCAVITHAHSDHARPGMRHYITQHDTVAILRLRLGQNISVEGLAFGQVRAINGVKVSLHPAGHITGSAQVRVEYEGEVWVASGDYKTSDDGYCPAFEPVKCHAFITESTFGMPIYHWADQKEIFSDINQWWNKNKEEKKASVVFCYSLGKAQRVLQGVDHSIGRVFSHGSVFNVNDCLRKSGIALHADQRIDYYSKKEDFRGALVLAPPSAENAVWLKKLGPNSTAVASGWMAVKSSKKRTNADIGFALSDHADWDGLLYAIKATEAERIFVTHGYTSSFAKYLREIGFDASEVQTEFNGEQISAEDVPADDQENSLPAST